MILIFKKNKKYTVLQVSSIYANEPYFDSCVATVSTILAQAKVIKTNTPNLLKKKERETTETLQVCFVQRKIFFSYLLWYSISR